MATFGENLRRERELRGVSLRDIAEATKISSRFLKALEEDRVDILPGGLFPRAFVKQYARHLGLDADRLVAEFLYAHADTLAEPESPKHAQDAPPRGGWFVIIVFLGIGLLWLMRDQPRVDTRVAATPAPQPAASTPADAVYPVPSSALASDALVLTLRAEQSCWVEASADGEKVLSRVLGEGETATLEAKGEIVLSVGNAGGLSFSVNNQPGVPLGRAGEVRRNVVITRQNLPSLVESSGPVTASHSS
jgi:cytoskeletal protein RodZ